MRCNPRHLSSYRSQISFDSLRRSLSWSFNAVASLINALSWDKISSFSIRSSFMSFQWSPVPASRDTYRSDTSCSLVFPASALSDRRRSRPLFGRHRSSSCVISGRGSRSKLSIASRWWCIERAISSRSWSVFIEVDARCASSVKRSGHGPDVLMAVPSVAWL